MEERKQEEISAENTEQSCTDSIVEENDVQPESKILEESAAQSESDAQGAAEPEGKDGKSVGRSIFEWVVTLLAAVAIALVIRSFVFEPVRVDGASMNDTLWDREVMFVSKYNYTSIWLTLPGAKDTENCSKFAVGGNPERFDVVICRYPGRGTTNFVKRVIGLPGDTVQLYKGKLFVNGDAVEEDYINDAYRTGYLANFGPYQVPEGQYFVMGDHRNNSNDSRSVGPIDRNMIIGKVKCVVFPFDSIRGIE